MSVQRTRLAFTLLIITVSVLFCYSQTTETGFYAVSQVPGTYNHDLQPVLSPVGDVTDLTYSFNSDGPWISSNRSPALQAMDGETRGYQIYVRANGPSGLLNDSFGYVIDKTPPDSPEPLLFPGTYFESTKLRFDVPDNGRPGARLVYSVSLSDGTQIKNQSAPEFFAEGKPGQVLSYRIDLAAIDAAGNSSNFVTYNYIIDRRRERNASEILVYSPVEGRFLNQQFLYLDDQYLREVRYTLDGSDPASQGKLYTDGVLLQASGKVQLRLWAKTYSGAELKKTINYEAGTDELAAVRSSFVTSQYILDAQGTSARYITGERAVNDSDQILDRPLRISPQTGSLRGIAIRILRAGDTNEFRYYFVLDGRVPAKPELWLRSTNSTNGKLVSVADGSAVSGVLDLQVQSSKGAQVYYTIDGTFPQDANANTRIDGSSRIPVETNGLISLRVQSRQGEGNWGPVASVNLHASVAQKVVLPVLVPGRGGELALSALAGTDDTWLQISSPFHNVEQGPFHITKDAEIRLPYGASGNFIIKLARGDKYSLSPWSDPQNVTLGIMPPREPVISIADKTVSISGENAIMYRVRSVPDGGPSATKTFVSYTQPIILKADTGNNVAYIVDAYSLDKNGNQSVVVSSTSIALVTRVPLGVQISQTNGVVYWNKTEGDVAIEHPEVGVRYYYVLENRDPDVKKDPFATSLIHLSLPIDPNKGTQDQRFTLSILPVSDLDGSVKGTAKHIPIVYDITPPELPLLDGVADGKSYNEERSISLKIADDQKAEYRLTKLGASSPAGAEDFSPYIGPVKVDVAGNDNSSFSLEFRVFDLAGNSAGTQKPIIFSIDKELPATPRLFNVSDNSETEIQTARVFALQPALILKSSPDARIFVEIAKNDGALKVPGSDSMAYENALMLPEVAEGHDELFAVQAIALDAAGNYSQPSPVFHIRVDRDPPKPPQEPRIIRNLNEGELLWVNENDVHIEVSQSNGEEQTEPQYKTAEARTSWSIADGADALTFQYRAIDEAGNASPSRQLTIRRTTQAAIPEIQGADNGGIYNSAVRIVPKPSTPQNIFRYELLTGNQQENGVDNNSPLLPADGLEIAPLAGESLAYTLIVKQFGDNTEPSQPLRLNFTIDRNPPAAPKVSGIQRLNYYSSAQNLTLEAGEGDTVFVAKFSETISFSNQSGQTNDIVANDRLNERGYQVSKDNIRLDASDNGVTHYILGAYSVDSAGNKSLTTQIWEFYVDAQSVYVADSAVFPRASSENGTRNQPFSDLSKAVSFAVAQKKRNLIVSNGNFPIRSSLTISGTLSISGGYDPKDWRQLPDLQTLIYPAQIMNSAVVSIVAGSQVELRSLYLIDGGTKAGSLLSVDHADLSIQSSSLAVTATPSALISDGGKISLNSVIVSCNDPGIGTLMHLQGGSLNIDSSLVESSDLPPVLLKRSQSADYTLVDTTDCVVRIENSTIQPRRGFQTVALRSKGGSLNVESGEIYTGQGTQLAVGVDLISTTFSAAATKFSSDKVSTTTVVIRSASSTVNLDSVNMIVSAQNGAYGIVAGNSRISVRKSSLKNERTNDFVTMMSIDSSNVVLEQNTVDVAASPDFQFLSLRESSSNVSGNSLKISGMAPAGSALISLNGQGTHTIEDNVFTGDDASTLVYLGSSKTNIILRSNVLERWRLLLQVPQENVVRQSDALVTISTIDELEALERKGSLFEGNRIRQGL